MKILPAIPGVRPAMMIKPDKAIFRYVDHTIVSNEELIAILSPHEAAVLGILAKAKGRVVSWESMAKEIWIHERDVKDHNNNLRQYIRKLKQALDPLGYRLENVFGLGYRLWPTIEVDWSNPP